MNDLEFPGALAIKDLTLLPLWLSFIAMAQVQSLTRKLLHVMSVAKKTPPQTVKRHSFHYYHSDPLGNPRALGTLCQERDKDQRNIS